MNSRRSSFSEIKRKLTRVRNAPQHELCATAAALGGMTIPAILFAALKWAGASRAGEGFTMSPDN